MNPTHHALYVAHAEAAGSGCGLGPEWEERLSDDPKLRSIAERFKQTAGLLRELREIPAPSSLEGRVVSTLQAGHREDRAVESLCALTPQVAPPELEALVAESLPGASQLEAPPELDERIEALLRDWEGAEEVQGQAKRAEPRSTLRRVGPLGLAAAASLLFVVVIAAPWKGGHERARDAYVQSVEVAPAEWSTEGMSPFGEELLKGATGGISEFASRRGALPNTPNPRSNHRAPSGSGGRAVPLRTPAGAGSQSGSQNSSAGGTGAAGRSGADILTKLADGYTTPHFGSRKVRLMAGLSSPVVLIYLEEVSVAEDGAFMVEPTEVLQPQMDQADEGQFILFQKTREGFIHRFRDFRIRDLSLFTQQYTTTQGFNSEMVAGLECVELDIRRTDGEGYRYLLWVHPVSGICLRVQEYDADDQFVGEVEYQSINFAPSFIAPLTGGPSVWAPISESTNLGEVLLPLWIPEGYVPVSTETRSDSQGGEWVMLRYTDGIETLFVLQTVLQSTGTTPPRGPVQNALTRISVHKIGSWTAVEGDAGGVHLAVLGKRPEADLVATLASTAP